VSALIIQAQSSRYYSFNLVEVVLVLVVVLVLLLVVNSSYKYNDHGSEVSVESTGELGSAVVDVLVHLHFVGVSAEEHRPASDEGVGTDEGSGEDGKVLALFVTEVAADKGEDQVETEDNVTVLDETDQQHVEEQVAQEETGNATEYAEPNEEELLHEVASEYSQTNGQQEGEDDSGNASALFVGVDVVHHAHGRAEQDHDEEGDDASTYSHHYGQQLASQEGHYSSENYHNQSQEPGIFGGEGNKAVHGASRAASGMVEADGRIALVR